MPVVQTPDGKVIQFPDSMSDQEINTVLAQDPNQALRATKMYGSAALQGLGQLAGLPGTIESAIGRGVTSGLNWLTGSNVPAAPPTIVPTGESIVGGMTNLGLTNRPEAIPITPKEKLISGAVSGGASAGPFGLGAAALGAVSGAVSEGAHELFPGSALAPTAAGMLTGFGVGGLANMVENALTGRSLSRAITDAESRLLSTQTTRENIPAAAAQVAATIHPASTLQEAGAQLQAGAKKWAIGDPANGVKSVMQQKMDAVWNPVTTLIGDNAPVEFKTLNKVLADINTSAGRLQTATDRLQPQEAKALQADIKNVQDLIDVQGGVPLTWGEAKVFRSAIGNARRNDNIVKNIGDENLDNIYRAISTDMRNAAKAKGPDALAAFDAANTESSRLYGIAKNYIQPILKKAPEDAAAKLISSAKKGGTALTALRGEMPDAIDALAAAHLRTAGSDWGDLSQEGKLALTGNPGVVGQMDSILASGAKKNVLSAKEALAGAKEKLKAFKSPRFNPMEGVLGGQIGYDLGVLGLNALGMQGHDILGGSVGSLIGAGMSKLGTPLISGYVRNPRNLRYPLAGGLGGLSTSNQLLAAPGSQ